MIFTSYEYATFLGLLFVAYWCLPFRVVQNVLLLGASYVFYGWIHPWFCLLIAGSTIVDYLCGLGMMRHPQRKKPWLVFSLVMNLGMLGIFKYFNFFAENVIALGQAAGIDLDPITTRIFLPVGISFYTFQTLSYTIDIYFGKLEARRSLLDFAVFVSFFAQLVAGPIERAKTFLPQIERPRRWDSQRFLDALPLLVSGFLKKLVVADSVAIVVNKIFMLEAPSFSMLVVGALAFAVQIYADFSAYTDIARGSARLVGFELMENFNSPYLAISPSDFWRRWHISFSSWIRDYLYIPLGGSRVEGSFKVLLVLLVSMGLSGLWHGAAWNFVVWGIYHALLLFAWRQLGLGGRWVPANRLTRLLAWMAMSCFTLIGWTIFRAPSMSWLVSALGSVSFATTGEGLVVPLYALASVGLYSLPLFMLLAMNCRAARSRLVQALSMGVLLVITVLFAREGGQDFIYFQF